MDTISVEEVFKLSAGERLRIAAEIWDSVADQPELLPLTALQAQELDARYADHLQYPEDAMDWATAKARVLKQL